jgi:GT2 family glycosyltransferase
MQSPAPSRDPGLADERVAVVVLNWNGWPDTIACLDSIRQGSIVPRVVVVDNGSTDGSPGRIRAESPWANLVELPSNRGFGGGMNAGIAAALRDGPSIDYVWVLNNDTLVEPQTLSRMVSVGDADARIGIVGSRLVDADGTGRIQAMGGGTVNRWLGTTSTRLVASPGALEHLVGASLLVRRTVLLEIGGFDERYFFYLEDTDLTLRTRRAGWRLAVADDATVVHRRGASINHGVSSDADSRRSLRSDVSVARSSAIFVSSLGMPWKLTAVPLRWAGMTLNRLARRQPRRVIPMTRAYLDGLRIGRSDPRIPVFGSAERGLGEPARPAPPVPNAREGGQR